MAATQTLGEAVSQMLGMRHTELTLSGKINPLYNSDNIEELNGDRAEGGLTASLNITPAGIKKAANVGDEEG